MNVKVNRGEHSATLTVDVPESTRLALPRVEMTLTFDRNGMSAGYVDIAPGTPGARTSTEFDDGAVVVDRCDEAIAGVEILAGLPPQTALELVPEFAAFARRHESRRLLRACVELVAQNWDRVQFLVDHVQSEVGEIPIDERKLEEQSRWEAACA